MHGCGDQSKIVFADGEQTNAQRVAPVRPAGGEFKLVQQWPDGCFHAIHPVDVAAMRLEAVPHVEPVGLAAVNDADSREALVAFLPFERLVGGVIGESVAGPGAFQGAELAVADLNVSPVERVPDVFGGNHADPVTARLGLVMGR